ncbi:hypothetical protein ACFV6G_26365 [Streptomyces lavendulae]|uniref:hypothetical protein n=1 Tax=Streptomyces lavendulae TaxID=1914 RepID=UPI0036A823EB
MTNRLRAEYTELLVGHLPVGPALLFAGGRHVDPDDLTDLDPALHQLPDRDPGSGRRAYRDDRGPVLTSRAVLAWLTAEHGDLIADALPQGVLPEAAVTDLITHLARAGAHELADALLTDLGVLGVKMAGPARNRATLAEDTAAALDLIRTADAAGYLLTMPDALCAAAARRLEAALVAVDLLTPAAPLSHLRALRITYGYPGIRARSRAASAGGCASWSSSAMPRRQRAPLVAAATAARACASSGTRARRRVAARRTTQPRSDPLGLMGPTGADLCFRQARPAEALSSQPSSRCM